MRAGMDKAAGDPERGHGGGSAALGGVEKPRPRGNGEGDKGDDEDERDGDEKDEEGVAACGGRGRRSPTMATTRGFVAFICKSLLGRGKPVPFLNFCLFAP